MSELEGREGRETFSRLQTVIGGVELSTLYLIGLIVAGSLTIINALFGDLLDIVFESLPGGFINPTVVLSFIAVLCGSGFIFENSTGLSSLTGFLISILIAVILVTLLHMLVLAPLSKAESSVGFHLKDLIGDYGKVTTSIGRGDDIGEVIVKTTFSIKGYPARSVEDNPIPAGEEVQIVDVDMEKQILIVSQEEKKLITEEK
ncbi:NfeD family protein [Alteribacter populi]|uniref:NfeD family protein n=1 Tax=Alteribacter populi TaxID=2011011 RepID=UPI000BBA7ED0|nr:NfeD family protein [Alteribacter populi]